MNLLLQVKIYQLKEQLKVFTRFYKNRRFALIDLALSVLYLFSNPYRICRRFLQKRGEAQIHAYGETPLTTLSQIAAAFGITAADCWLELGAGRGRGCFWMAEIVGCRAVGIEWIPTFVRRANWVQRLFCSRASFQNFSMHKADFSAVTVVYLYSTCLSSEEEAVLLSCMGSLPVGSKVISISEPFEDSSFSLAQALPVSFPWGETEAYLHIKI